MLTRENALNSHLQWQLIALTQMRKRTQPIHICYTRARVCRHGCRDRGTHAPIHVHLFPHTTQGFSQKERPTANRRGVTGPAHANSRESKKLLPACSSSSKSSASHPDSSRYKARKSLHPPIKAIRARALPQVVTVLRNPRASQCGLLRWS